MKGSALLVLVLILSVDVFAQSPKAQSDAPDLTVIKKSWRKESYYIPALSADPFRANDEQAQLNRARRDNSSSNRVRVQEGNTPEQTTVPKTKPKPAGSEGAYVRFTYRVTVKNSSAKTITNVAWNYGTHSFQSQVKIRTGKSTELVGMTNKPPSSVVDAGDAQLAEEVVIHRIQYEDGSFWERPDN